jgi:hypothetical protein
VSLASFSCAASALDPKIITNTFQITLDVPSDYKYMVQEPDFIWLKKELVSGNTSLLLYQVPINAKEQRQFGFKYH